MHATVLGFRLYVVLVMVCVSQSRSVFDGGFGRFSGGGHFFSATICHGVLQLNLSRDGVVPSLAGLPAAAGRLIAQLGYLTGMQLAHPGPLFIYFIMRGGGLV